MMEEQDREFLAKLDHQLANGEPLDCWKGKPSHDTIEFNTISVLDAKTGKRRYFRLYGKHRERIRECSADGLVVVTGKPPIGWLKNYTLHSINSHNKWYVDSQPRRNYVCTLGLGHTRMEAVYDYCNWWVNSVEVMQQHDQSNR
jgi:hypothetical protein